MVRSRLTFGLAIAAGLLAATSAPARQAQPAPPAFAGADCPDALPAGTRCWSGRASTGAYHWLAVPEDWNRVLVVHAHGGPRLGDPQPDDPVEDLERFSMTVREGYAWAGSSYRRGGYGVRMAAEDTDQLRQLVWDFLGRPRHTILHGQSWGGNVAAKAAELYARDAEGRVVWDGVALTSGLLAGGTRGYGFRADLRAVYQAVCRNHPAPDEPQYPLWSGLPAESDLTRADLARRVETCTGVGRPASERTSDQAARLKDILTVVGIEEAQLVPHLAWGTFLFRDLVQLRLDGLNPFDNQNRVYAGSRDDAALNAQVERFAADPRALARLAYDADLSGLIVAPTVTIHGIDDPTVFVSHSAAYRQTVQAAGRGDLLVQTFTREREHSRLSPPQYVAVFDALLDWIETGQPPSPRSIADRCQAAAPQYDAPCRFDLDFTPTWP